MSFSKSFDHLVESLSFLPGIGIKTARRMALDLVLKKQNEAAIIADAINKALQNIRKCKKCRNIADADTCLICQDTSRDFSTVCIVETPSDVLAIEQSVDFNGIYFVLMGHIAPLDGIGPEDLGLDILDMRLANNEINELVIATNSTLEGEATAYFLAELAAKHGIKATRLAHGVPMGGELSYLDKNTLSMAFKTRNIFKVNSHTY